MFITGPDVVKTVTNEEVGKEELGGAQTHSGKSGVTHFMCDNEEETLMSIRELLSFLPSNNMEDAPLVPCNDDIHRQVEALQTVIPEDPNMPYDIKDIIEVNKRRWEIEESFKIMKSEFKARPVYLQKDNRIEAHFLTCFIALMFIRILENKTGNKLTIEKLIDTLREYNFYHYEGSGYVPTYTRNDATDILHEAFGFRTDYQINGEKNMKKIIKNTKTGKY